MSSVIGSDPSLGTAHSASSTNSNCNSLDAKEYSEFAEKGIMRHAWTNILETIPGISRARAEKFVRKYSCPLAALKTIEEHETSASTGASHKSLNATEYIDTSSEYSNSNLSIEPITTEATNNCSNQMQSSLFAQIMSTVGAEKQHLTRKKQKKQNQNDDLSHKIFQKDFAADGVTFGQQQQDAADGSAGQSNKKLSHLVYTLMTSTNPLDKLI